MTKGLRTFLTFQAGVATAALDLYRAVFDDFELIEIEHYGPGDSGPEGTVKVALVATSVVPTARSVTNGGLRPQCHCGSTATTTPNSSNSSIGSARAARCSCLSTTMGSVPVSAGLVIATG